MPRRIKKYVESRLTRKEIKDLRERFKIEEELTSFQMEFRKHLATFITGAFAFVAALLWRDAIKSFLNKYAETIQNSLPWKEEWVIQLFTALTVSLLAVVAIVIISKILKVKSK